MNTSASPEQYRALINEAYRLEDEGDLSAALDRLDEAETALAQLFEGAAYTPRARRSGLICDGEL
jgi:hypothetical protein